MEDFYTVVEVDGQGDEKRIIGVFDDFAVAKKALELAKTIVEYADISLIRGNVLKIDGEYHTP